MALRVALLGIYHESNTFISERTELVDFEKSHWLTGSRICREYREAFHEIGGMIEVLDQEGVELIPVMYAEATPGGIITAATYETLLRQMLKELAAVLPVDGCLVIPHGAGVSEQYRDMDGHWLSLLREQLGGQVPIIGTIDPHANVSPLMIRSTNALIAYKTNPHIDQRERGKEAARMLVQMLRHQIRPVQQLLQLPLAISIEQQYDQVEPCKSLHVLAEAISNRPGMLSVSIVLGFPYADVPEMGTSIIVVSDDQSQQAQLFAAELYDDIISRKEKFVGTKNDIAAVLPGIEKYPRPVLLLDMGDNIGAGAPGNSTFLLRAIEAFGKYTCFICLHDPQIVRQAAQYQPGEIITIELPGGHDQRIAHRVKLLKMADGAFTEPDPRHGGQVHYDMGPIALLSTGSGSMILVTSLRIPPFSLRQLTAFDIDPALFDIIVAKGVNAPIAAYAPVCPTIIQVNTPGVTQADMTLFDFQHRRRPLFPFEMI
ncbi:M81 family metallopeptidase [Niabella aurantiaca]|uniref:M81 family metallopeptidase n=1 Tax=Niabella aurantiaca TaxID=379900 RepID=UPI000376DEDA|nr:M81 family metallopeptidase [Niabella aurantiaca]